MTNHTTKQDFSESGEEHVVSQPEVTVKEEKHTIGIGLMNWLIILLLMVISSAGSICIYDRYYAQKLTAFDLQGYLIKQRIAMQNNQLTEKQLGDNLDALKVKLDNIPSNQAVITADVVLRNIQTIKIE
ncbi:MAG: hypothetical protein ABFD82_04070 [Syntrophaceae bacterium]